MLLWDLRMLLETSSQITIMQFLFKSQVYSSVINSLKTDKKTFAAENW